MFPSELDGAKVLCYTTEGDYGVLKFPNGDIADRYRYLAICKYTNDGQYHLFCCDASYEVVNDWLADTAEACMEIAASLCNKNILWNRK